MYTPDRVCVVDVCCLWSRNRTNKKWNLLERSKVRRVVEGYASLVNFVEEKKQWVTEAFTVVPEELSSQGTSSRGSLLVVD